MRTPLLPGDLWNLIQPLLPCPPPRPRGGRPRLPHRACLTGILFVLRSGIPWEMLPQEIGCGSGSRKTPSFSDTASHRLAICSGG
jgi:transposase